MNIVLVPSSWVTLSTALAGIGWILFSRSQKGRFQANVLLWLSLPFFIVSLIYAWSSFIDMNIDTRAMYARLGFMVISLPQAIVFIILYFLNRGAHGKSY